MVAVTSMNLIDVDVENDDLVFAQATDASAGIVLGSSDPNSIGILVGGDAGSSITTGFDG